ncbi:hypothetical protein [Paenibacillus paridis]|uniref:hypothetical protein n=1 Tax=Paenibacillus paridis TaxID=2583376 RepID=UPI001391C62E|nr:hypothetical protein [Paenibacillus paridis]
MTAMERAKKIEASKEQKLLTPLALKKSSTALAVFGVIATVLFFRHPEAFSKSAE